MSKQGNFVPIVDVPGIPWMKMSQPKWQFLSEWGFNNRFEKETAIVANTTELVVRGNFQMSDKWAIDSTCKPHKSNDRSNLSNFDTKISHIMVGNSEFLRSE